MPEIKMPPLDSPCGNNPICSADMSDVRSYAP